MKTKLIILAAAFALLAAGPAFPRQEQDTDKPQDQQKQEEHRQDDKEKPKQQQENEKKPAQAANRDQHDAANRGRRIADADFRAHFGREHTFHVVRSDDRHFRFGGYSFEFVNAWPAGWLYTDNFYVEDIDGQYFLIDLFHPEVRLLVVIV
ncbi:MAG: hypothetical protein WB780_16360 [Candidatus Acidiferrales bacterium]